MCFGRRLSGRRGWGDLLVRRGSCGSVEEMSRRRRWYRDRTLGLRVPLRVVVICMSSRNDILLFGASRDGFLLPFKAVG